MTRSVLFKFDVFEGSCAMWFGLITVCVTEWVVLNCPDEDDITCY